MATFAERKTGEEQPARNFREVVQRRLMKDVIEAAAVLSRGWMVMVIDDAALRVVSALVGMYDVMEHRVTLIELLSKERQSLPEMEVIYLVTPTVETVQMMLNDFKDPKKPRYGDVHIFFLSKVTEGLMQMLGGNQSFLQRVRTFKEINMNFLATEAYAFHLDMPICIPKLFTTRPDNKVIEEVVNKLVSLCVTLNEYPHVRYNQHSVLGARIATLVQDALNDFVAKTEEWWYHGQAGHTDRERGQILILDRAEDPLTPCIHEHTYQAMLQDLLQMEDDKIIYETDDKVGRREVTALLNESDHLWVEFRHQHIARVLEQIAERTKDFISANAGVELTRKIGTDSKLSPAELALIIKQIPEYREMTGKLMMHTSITSDAMGKFTHYGIMDVSELEQTIATGQDADGKTVKEEKMLQSLTEMLGRLETQGMTLNNKMRLLAIFIIAQEGVSEEVRRQLVNAAGLTSVEQEMLIHLEAFGVSLQKSKTGTSSRLWSNKPKKGKRVAKAEEGGYVSSRYVPHLKDLMEQLVSGDLPVRDYPSVVEMPSREERPVAKSLRKANPNSRFGRARETFQGGRSIVFVAGGITFSEMRCAYEVMGAHNKEIIIGGTSYLKPDVFVEQLKDIK